MSRLDENSENWREERGAQKLTAQQRYLAPGSRNYISLIKALEIETELKIVA